MALSIDPLTSIISIPKADLTLISGTIYEMDTDQFRLDLKAWEASVEGIAFLKTHDHSTEVTVAGTTFARSVEILLPYSVEFEDGQYTVILKGSNNNIFDVENAILEQNQVQIIPSNAAGLIVVQTGSGVTEQDKLDIADRVWDEVLTGASHNTPTSAGRRLRDLSTSVIITGLALGATSNTILLNGDASSLDGAYDPAAISIINGTGAGQTRLILQYNGATKTCVVDRNWKVNPDVTSEYVISAHPGREHVNEGLAQGGTANTITLNTLGSSDNNAYVGQVVFIRSGTGEDQALRVIAYNGTTKVATVCENWAVIPDTTSGYVMLPSSVLKTDQIAAAIWDELVAGHTVSGSFAEELRFVLRLTGSKVTKSGDIITIYEENGTTPWRQYNLANGERIQI